MSETATKRKVSELEGAELDRWVDRALGNDPCSHTIWDCLLRRTVIQDSLGYSSEWEHGGPIIERELISLTGTFNGWGTVFWIAAPLLRLPERAPGANKPRQGPSPLIAAMRCFVASKFGEEVDETSASQSAGTRMTG